MTDYASAQISAAQGFPGAQLRNSLGPTSPVPQRQPFLLLLNETLTEDIQLAEEAGRKLSILLNDLGLSLPPARAEVPPPTAQRNQMPPTEQAIGMSRELRRGLSEVNILLDVLRQQLLG